MQTRRLPSIVFVTSNSPRGRHMASWRLSETLIKRKAVETSSSVATEPELSFARMRAVLYR